MLSSGFIISLHNSLILLFSWRMQGVVAIPLLLQEICRMLFQGKLGRLPQFFWVHCVTEFSGNVVPDFCRGRMHMGFICIFLRGMG